MDYEKVEIHLWKEAWRTLCEVLSEQRREEDIELMEAVLESVILDDNERQILKEEEANV